jgi:hypothetical protein
MVMEYFLAAVSFLALVAMLTAIAPTVQVFGLANTLVSNLELGVMLKIGTTRHPLLDTRCLQAIAAT